MSHLSIFGNYWKAVPYAMSVLVSGDAFLTLYHLVRKSRGFMNTAPIKISKTQLAQLIGKSRNATDTYINELKELNIVSEHTCDNGKTSVFTINWEEIQKTHALTSKISDKGWVALRSKCKNTKISPFSSIDSKTCSEIEQVYKTSYGTYSKNEQVLNENDTTCSEIEQVRSSFPQTCSEIEQVCNEFAQKLHNLSPQLGKDYILKKYLYRQVENTLKTCSIFEHR